MFIERRSFSAQSNHLVVEPLPLLVKIYLNCSAQKKTDRLKVRLINKSIHKLLYITSTFLHSNYRAFGWYVRFLSQRRFLHQSRLDGFW